jgi:hypothetical protein
MARFTREIYRFQSISADRLNFVLGIKKAKKRSFFNKIGNSEAILTVDIARFTRGNIALSNPQSFDRPNSVLGDILNAKKVLNGNLSIDNTFYPQVTC